MVQGRDREMQFNPGGDYPPRETGSPAAQPRSPKSRLLIIVAREEHDLCAYMTRLVAEDENVQVLLDRRRPVSIHMPEPREADRRCPQKMENDLRYRPFVIAREQGSSVLS